MKTWCIDFENEELGISVDAKQRNGQWKLRKILVTGKTERREKYLLYMNFRKGVENMTANELHRMVNEMRRFGRKFDTRISVENQCTNCMQD